MYTRQSVSIILLGFDVFFFLSHFRSLAENSVENFVYPYERYPRSAYERYMSTDSPPDFDAVRDKTFVTA